MEQKTRMAILPRLLGDLGSRGRPKQIPRAPERGQILFEVLVLFLTLFAILMTIHLRVTEIEKTARRPIERTSK